MSEVQGQATSEVTQTVSAPSTSAPAPTTTTASATPTPSAPSKMDALRKTADAKSSPSQKTDAIGETSTAPVEPPKPTYTPNYKMKVYHEEKEIDEMFRPLIKDADSEDKVKKMLEKAYGMDIQKPKYQKLQEDHQKLNQTYNGLDKSLKQLSKFLNEDDMESFFGTLKIPDEKVLRYTQRLLQKMDMDPNQRAEQDRIRNDRLRASQLEEQHQELQANYRQEQANTALVQTEMILSRPEISQYAEAFDRISKNGTFFEAVCRQGMLASQQGTLLTPEQAVQEAIRVHGPFLESHLSQAQSQAQMPAQVQAKPPPPTLPNVSGRSSSPIKQAVRSIADLKKLANQI